MFSAKDVCWIGLEIAKGIEFLHTQKNPIIHRDLKVCYKSMNAI
jgi:serine/threonine protein kinase